MLGAAWLAARQEGEVVMDWEIRSFVGLGPITFGMTPEQVATNIGPPRLSDEDDEDVEEHRSIDSPIVRYEGGEVSEIEAFYDVPNVRLGQLHIFAQDGRSVLQELERRNGGAMIDVGIVMFDKLGMTCGRLDEGSRGDHSITAFREGLWDDQMGDFKPVSFL